METFSNLLYVLSISVYLEKVGFVIKVYFISCWMIRSNCKFSKKTLPVMVPRIPANLQPSFSTVMIFFLYSDRVMRLSFITSSPRSPFMCSVSTFLKNLCTPMSIVRVFSSSCSINPLLVKTFLTSRMVSFLSSISNASNSSLVFEFKIPMSLVASVGLSPNYSLVFSIACLDLYTSSCCSRKNCMNGHISSIDLSMSI
jgi:hypothetical protein